MADRTPDILDAPPTSEHVTDYDRRHLKTYLRLLDADADEADWREVAAIVLGLDPAHDAIRAKRVHMTHLERARWMTRVNYRDLLTGRYAH